MGDQRIFDRHARAGRHAEHRLCSEQIRRRSRGRTGNRQRDGLVVGAVRRCLGRAHHAGRLRWRAALLPGTSVLRSLFARSQRHAPRCAQAFRSAAGGFRPGEQATGYAGPGGCHEVARGFGNRAKRLPGGGAGRYSQTGHFPGGAVSAVVGLARYIIRQTREASMLRAFIAIVFAVPSIAVASDRGVAEWVLRAGGSVSVGDGRPEVWDITQLPAGDVQVRAVNLVATTLKPKDFELYSAKIRAYEQSIVCHLIFRGTSRSTLSIQALTQL